METHPPINIFNEIKTFSVNICDKLFNVIHVALKTQLSKYLPKISDKIGSHFSVIVINIGSFSEFCTK